MGRQRNERFWRRGWKKENMKMVKKVLLAQHKRQWQHAVDNKDKRGKSFRHSYRTTRRELGKASCRRAEQSVVEK
jgi:hypothetical protein